MTRTDLLVADDRPDLTTSVAAQAPPRKKRRIIAVAAIIGLAAIGGAVILTGGFGARARPNVLRTTTTTPATSIAPTTSSPTTSAPTTSSTSTSVAATPHMVTASVPVVACQTTWAVPGDSPLKLPSSVTVSLPLSLVGQVTDYMDQQEIMQLIGTKGWLCTAGYGADGGGGAGHLHMKALRAALDEYTGTGDTASRCSSNKEVAA